MVQTSDLVFKMLSRHGLRAGSVEPAERGNSGAVFRANIDGETTFVRIGSKPKIDLQVAIKKLLSSHNIPHPIIKYCGDDHSNGMRFSIEPEINGREISTHSCSTERPRLYQSAGKILRRIHLIPIDGFGRLTYQSKYVQGESNTWPTYLNKLRPNIDKLVRNGIVDRQISLAFGMAMKRLLTIPKSRGFLLHNDYNNSHIFSDGERITGIIDWDRARSGDPIYDLAMSKHFLGNDFDDLLKGYGEEIDRTRFNDYRLFIILLKIEWCHTIKKGDLQVNLQRLSHLRHELSI